jgi:hypothetical protein
VIASVDAADVLSDTVDAGGAEVDSVCDVDGELADVADDEPSSVHEVAAAAPITAQAIDPVTRAQRAGPLAVERSR